MKVKATGGNKHKFDLYISDIVSGSRVRKSAVAYLGDIGYAPLAALQRGANPPRKTEGFKKKKK